MPLPTFPAKGKKELPTEEKKKKISDYISWHPLVQFPSRRKDLQYSETAEVTVQSSLHMVELRCGTQVSEQTEALSLTIRMQACYFLIFFYDSERGSHSGICGLTPYTLFLK